MHSELTANLFLTTLQVKLQNVGFRLPIILLRMEESVMWVQIRSEKCGTNP